VRGHGGLYQQIGRAPSPFQNTSPPRQQHEPQPIEPDSEEEEEGKQTSGISEVVDKFTPRLVEQQSDRERQEDEKNWMHSGFPQHINFS